MNKNIKNWFLAGTAFTVIFGTLLHFLYQWSGNNPVVGIFGAVNESTWEHLKLLFWPALIFSIIEFIFIGKEYNNYITAKAISFYLGIALIIILFYTYTGIVGNNYLMIDLLIFLVSVIISQFAGYRITVSDYIISKKTNIKSFIAIIILAAAFIIFTYNPPQIALFKDPLAFSGCLPALAIN